MKSIFNQQGYYDTWYQINKKKKQYLKFINK